MWNVAALLNGEWVQVDSIAIENGRPPSLADVVAQAERMQNARFMRFLSTESSLVSRETNVVSANDRIELWAARAEHESLEFNWASPGKLKQLEEALAYFASTPQTTNDRPDTLAWHDYSTVIIPAAAALQQLMIEYTPSIRDENRVERLKFRYGSSEHRLEIIFEARGYYGTESAVIDHWREMRRSGHGYVASMRGSAGFIVGRVLRRLGGRSRH
jgi:hypothetical protein